MNPRSQSHCASAPFDLCRKAVNSLRIDKRSWTYQAMLLAASNLFLHLLGFAYRTVLSRVAGAEGMGVYTLVMQVYAILYAVCLSGICTAVSAISARFYQQANHCAIRRLVRTALGAFVILFLMAASPVVLFTDWIADSLLGDPRTTQALLMVLACIFLTGLENVFKSVFHGCRQVKWPIFSEVGEQLLRIAFVLLLLVRFENGDHGHTAFLIILGMTLSEIFSSSFLFTCYCFRFLRRQPGLGRPIPGLRRDFYRIFVPTAATSVISNMFSSVATILFPVRLMVAGFTRSAAVAALGILSAMAEPLMMLPVPFINSLNTMMLPNIAGAVSVGDRKGTKRKIRKAFFITAIFAIPVTALLLPFVPKLCLLLFHQRIGPTLAFMLAIHTAIVYFLSVSVSILNGLGEQKKVLAYAMIGEGVQLMLIWFLAAVPQLNVYGYLIGMILGDFLRLSCNLRRVWLAVFANA